MSLWILGLRKLYCSGDEMKEREMAGAMDRVRGGGEKYTRG